jgi:hypothetical protein
MQNIILDILFGYKSFFFLLQSNTKGHFSCFLLLWVGNVWHYRCLNGMCSINLWFNLNNLIIWIIFINKPLIWTVLSGSQIKLRYAPFAWSRGFIIFTVRNLQHFGTAPVFQFVQNSSFFFFRNKMFFLSFHSRFSQNLRTNNLKKKKKEKNWYATERLLVKLFLFTD